MSTLKELLEAFPEYWQTGDESVPVLILTYHGASCWVKIENNIMEIVPSGSSRTIIPLDQIVEDSLTHIPFQLTLKQLGTQLATIPNMEVELVENSFHFFADGSLKPHDLDNIWRTYPNIWTNYALPGGLTRAEDTNSDGILDTVGWYLNVPGTARPLMIPGFPTSIGDLGAVILTDTNQDIVKNRVLGAPTNLIWPLLKPMARMLSRARDYGEEMVRQMDLRNVDGPWLDRWGEVYGVQRLPHERDSTFKKRLVSTTFKPRLSPTSIEKALIEGFGFSDAHVSDVSPLIGNHRNYTFTTAPYKFLVQFDAVSELAHNFGDPVTNLIDIYRAAGTRYEIIGTVEAPVEEVSRPLQTFRMRKIFPDTSIEGFSSVEDGPWGIDFDVTTVSLGTTPGLFGGRMFGDGVFG